MRKHSATALPFMVVLNSHSQPSLRQNLATGIQSTQFRWDYNFTYQHSCYSENGFAFCTKSVSSTHDITGKNWYDNEKQPFVNCTTGLGAFNVGGAGETARIDRLDIPTTTNL
jgi:hypothetical protein